MESFIDRVARTFNHHISTVEQGIGEAIRNANEFKEILANKDVIKVEKKETPEEIRKNAINAISDFKDMYRPEAGDVTNDMIYQNHENMLEEAMNNLNTITNNPTDMEKNNISQTVQTQKNEGIDR